MPSTKPNSKPREAQKQSQSEVVAFHRGSVAVLRLELSGAWALYLKLPAESLHREARGINFKSELTAVKRQYPSVIHSLCKGSD
jgi:hypothetical protein